MNTKNFQKVSETCLKNNAQLVAVSKTRTVNEIKQMYDAGQRVFGENRVQELLEKYEQLPNNVNWHLIGHLQSNKVKYIAPFIALIHSVDSLGLLNEINTQAAKNDRIIECLLQFYIAKESTKYGLDYSEALDLLNSSEYQQMQNIKIVGVMGMATFTDNENQVRSEFKALKNIFDQLKTTFFTNNSDFKEISMGMSGDYELAIAEGSTMVRVGSFIF
jgi:pyridoxal phosphate enzyme (YggS family)